MLKKKKKDEKSYLLIHSAASSVTQIEHNLNQRVKLMRAEVDSRHTEQCFG